MFIFVLGLTHAFSTSFYRFYDVVVARAAANVALKLVADGFFIECVVAINHVNRADDHAWRTLEARVARGAVAHRSTQK